MKESSAKNFVGFLGRRYDGERLFEPDTLAPSQFWDRVRSTRSHLGEHGLLFAVLEDGIDTYMKYRGTRSPFGRALFEEAQAWLNEDAADLCSFRSLCELFDLDPDSMREGILRLAPPVDAEPVPRQYRPRVTPDTLRELTVRTRRILRLVGRPRTARELMAMLREDGGEAVTNEVLADVLRRGLGDGAFIRLGRFWGLPSWTADQQEQSA